MTLPRVGFSSPRAVAATAPLLLVATSPADTARAPVTITVTARDSGVQAVREDRTRRPGDLRRENTGKHDHSFQVAGKKTAVMKPGKTAKLVSRSRRPARSPILDRPRRRGQRDERDLHGAGGVRSRREAVFVTAGCGVATR